MADHLDIYTLQFVMYGLNAVGNLSYSGPLCFQSVDGERTGRRLFWKCVVCTKLYTNHHYTVIIV